MLADYSQISNLTEAEFAKKLITDYGVASIPVSVFYDTPVEHHVVRFCFAKEDRTLQQALARFSALGVTAGFLSRVPNGTGITSMPSSFKSAASSFDAIPRIERFGASS